MNGAALAEACRGPSAHSWRRSRKTSAQGICASCFSPMRPRSASWQKTGGGSAGNVWVRLGRGTNGLVVSASRHAVSGRAAQATGRLAPSGSARRARGAAVRHRRWALYKGEFIPSTAAPRSGRGGERQPASAARVVPRLLLPKAAGC